MHYSLYSPLAFLQMTLGMGNPSAEQFIHALLPNMADVFKGSASHAGGTASKWKTASLDLINTVVSEESIKEISCNSLLMNNCVIMFACTFALCISFTRFTTREVESEG